MAVNPVGTEGGVVSGIGVGDGDGEEIGEGVGVGDGDVDGNLVLLKVQMVVCPAAKVTFDTPLFVLSDV